MARVMVSLPDDLLRALDTEAARRRVSRSGLLRELVEHAVRQCSVRRAQRMAEIDATYGPPSDYGGNVADLVKAYRPKH